MEDEINHLTEINPGDMLIPLLRTELQKVQHFAGLLMEPSGVIPDTHLSITIDNPLANQRHLSTVTKLKEYQDVAKETFLDVLGEDTGEEHVKGVEPLQAITLKLKRTNLIDGTEDQANFAEIEEDEEGMQMCSSSPSVEMLDMDLNQPLSPSLLASEQLYQEIPPDPNVLILKETDMRPVLRYDQLIPANFHNLK